MAVEYAPRPVPEIGALTTRRLVLRSFRLSDAPTVQRLAGDFDVAKMLDVVPFPYPEGEAARWIATHDDRRAQDADYPFAIEHDGEVVGCVGLNRESDGLLHLGYWIGVPFWGKGFATEAARAALEFAFDELTEPEVKSGHYADNHASGRVMTKLGFRYAKESMRFSKARGHAVRFLDTRMKREWFKR
ncbi:MAG: GNAT family N-acetyltransferase [Alphaproteobacteria bacterium]|nr:GNAT family N-acetyltransferase [Alphaproteobacteria bacterium]